MSVGVSVRCIVYFDRGQYTFPLAGVTALCPPPSSTHSSDVSKGCVPAKGGAIDFAAYRVHAGLDPLVFESEGLQLTWRNGEPGHGGRPCAAGLNASTFALVYVW